MLGLLAVAAAGANCGSPPIEGAQPTVLALGQAVLEAFQHRDVAALRSVAISEQEFRDHVWPQLPASRPGRNLPFSYVWGELRQKSEQSLARLLESARTQPLELVRVEYGGKTTRYAGSAVHRDTVLVVRDRKGAEQRVRIYGSTFEKDGSFKVFSFVVDD